MRRLVIMGSGETTPTMVTTHQKLLAGLGPDPDARLLDTPYGFQENADDITDRALTYFSHHVGHRVVAESFRRQGRLSAVEHQALLGRLADADWVFAGPGSPSYLLSQWHGAGVPEVIADKLTRHGVVVFASAAACTLGSHAVPVYEVYKAGHDPFWLDGFGLVADIGLPAVVIPHFDNAEGGTHDTRFCYLGERRLQRLAEDLPEDTWILGVDEHTAAILDLDTDTLHVEGRGAVTVRTRAGASRRWEAGESAGFAELRATGAGHLPDEPSRRAGVAAADPPAPAESGPRAEPLAVEAERLWSTFSDAVEDSDALAATEATLSLEQAIRDWSADTQQSDATDRAVAVLRQMITRLGQLAQEGMHDHRELLAPHVETLLDLREQARRSGDFVDADTIRDRLRRGGVEVHDTEHGPAWEHADG